MRRDDTRLQVTCYAGYVGEESPRKLHWKSGETEAVEVMDRWRTPQHRHFKCLAADGTTYVIYQDLATGHWHCASVTPSGGRRGMKPD